VRFFCFPAMRAKNFASQKRAANSMPCGQETLGLKRRHAAHTRRCNSLAENLVFHVARSEHARDAGFCRVRRRADIAVLVHIDLSTEYFRRRRMPYRDE